MAFALMVEPPQKHPFEQSVPAATPTQSESTRQERSYVETSMSMHVPASGGPPGQPGRGKTETPSSRG
jgi:hypothetical protein